MKKLLLILPLAFSLLPCRAPAAILGAPTYAGYSAVSTNAGSAPDCIIGCNSTSGGAPRVTYLNVTGDAAGSVLTSYRVDAGPLQCTFTNSTTTLFVVTTNATQPAINWQSGTVVIRHQVNDWYEKRALAANSASTNLVLTVAPLQTVVPGDLVYHCVANSVIPIGVQTNQIIAASGIIVGQPGMPLLMDLNGTTARITAATADFVK